MAKFFSRKSKGSMPQDQNERPSTRKRFIKRFLGKTRDLFRGNVIIEPSRPCQPLSILALAQTPLDLQSEIDEELKLLSERNPRSYTNSSSANVSEQPILRTLKTRSQLASVGTDSTLPSKASDGSLAPCVSTSRTSVRSHTQALAIEVTADASSQHLPENLAAGSSFRNETETISKDARSADRVGHCVSSDNILDSMKFSNVTFFEEKTVDDADLTYISSLFVLPPSKTSGLGHAVPETDEAFMGAEVVRGDFSGFAQPQAEIDIIRRQRSAFSRSLEAALTAQKAELDAKCVAELAEQKASLDAAEVERYESTASLHEIEILNLQDDHEAEVKDLKKSTKDLHFRLVTKDKEFRASKREVKSLMAKSSAAEEQLQGKSNQCDEALQAFHGRETTLKRQADEICDLKQALARARDRHEGSMRAAQVEDHAARKAHKELEERYNALLIGFNQLNSDRQALEAQVEAQLKKAFLAHEEDVKTYDALKARYDFVVAEKTRNFSWHVAHRLNPCAMKPLPREDELSVATASLRQELTDKDEVNAELYRQLEATRASMKARVKKLKRVIARQSQEIVIDEMALEIAQGQRDHWADTYQELAEAAASEQPFSSYARGLAERHLLLQATRLGLEQRLVDAKLRGDRALLEVAIRKQHEAIKLEKRDATIARLTESLASLTSKLELKQSLATAYREAFDNEMPRLRERNREVEAMLSDQLINNVGANHGLVFRDQKARIERLEAGERWWERQLTAQLQEYEALKSDFQFTNVTTYRDLASAHVWRNERDQLEVEIAAFKDRFAHELLLEPLVVPAHYPTRQRIEDDFTLEQIDDGLIKLYNHTFDAVPKVVLGMHVPPWEQLLVDVECDVAEQKRRWIELRDEEVARFGQEPVREIIGREEEGEEKVAVDSDPDPDGFEVTWKGKGKMAGEGVGSDGQRAPELEKEREREREQPSVAGPSWDGGPGDPTLEFF